jgi:hypothetical protein
VTASPIAARDCAEGIEDQVRYFAFVQRMDHASTPLGVASLLNDDYRRTARVAGNWRHESEDWSDL